MNCEEVMEYMQRYLDDDLTDNEKDSMFAHLKSCVSCKEMFERLNRLSDELVSLPKVTPPFSIVESILPQLEALDHQRHAAGSAGVHSSASGRRPHGKWKTPRIISGVAAAACLIVAVSVGSMNGWFKSENLNTASPLITVAESSAGGSSGTSSGGSPGSGSSSAAATADSEETAHDGIAMRLDPANAEANSSSYGPSATSGATTPPVDKNASRGVAARGGQASGTPMGGGVSGSEGVGSYEGAGAVHVVEPAMPVQDHGDGFTTAPEQGGTLLGQGQQGEASGATPQQEVWPEKEVDGTGNIYSIAGGLQASDAPDVTFDSPDGQFSAHSITEESGRIRVVIVDSSGERVFVSEAKQTDGIEWLEWSDDGNALLYTAKGGAAEGTYEIKLDILTEAKK